MPWQLQSLEALASSPIVDITKAEQSGLELSDFLTHAPNDFIEPLMASPFGRVYKIFLERCCTTKFPGTQAENRRLINVLVRILWYRKLRPKLVQALKPV
jgi:hypothetical protein